MRQWPSRGPSSWASPPPPRAAITCTRWHERADAPTHCASCRALERNNAVVGPSFLAIAYLGIGERERAIAQLEAGYKARDPLLQYIVVESYLDEVMDSPRVRRIVAGMDACRTRANPDALRQARICRSRPLRTV